MEPAVFDDPRTTAHDSNSAAAKPGCKRVNPRPQRLNTWFTLIPVAEYEKKRPSRIPFLDTFVTVEPIGADGETPYAVFFEGKLPMTAVVEIGVLFVWYGDDLQKPDRPFPTLFAEPYDSAYVTSTATLFEDTHVMDFVENGSDNLHFRAVHLWEYSKIYDHVVTAETITLKQDTRFRYGSCSTRRSIRWLSKVLPKLELTQDYVYHGPGLAVVGATGSRIPRMHALVSLTPEGANRTRVYVTMAIDPATFPAAVERVYGAITRGRRLCDLLARIMANYIKNEFDVDAIIWKNKKYLGASALLPSERHLRDVIEWGKTFYPKGFHAPATPERPAEARQWRPLDTLDNVAPGQVHRYTIDDAELIARRDAGGTVRVYDAFCPHQGAHLGFGGVIDRDCLRCPFHGFYFDSEGRCIGPNIANEHSFITSLNLTSVSHRVRDGRIEVWL
ncbi:Rieske 2Fe-2S domain-containing protein [Mycobacterium spongiae]|uniref:cholesterol 7-desaturase n=1 Tax=Mycobacterium spongiae TaxID=886343 RepID=A0A975JUC8_9MYCO|nr:Rieske 2Fe-2S domain-containing protein [Mycobacterium spongiae]QUR65821.1 Rieske 2Fe-2S domain-containing protein [Mycobacterium spongiae]